MTPIDLNGQPIEDPIDPSVAPIDLGDIAPRLATVLTLDFVPRVDPEPGMVIFVADTLTFYTRNDNNDAWIDDHGVSLEVE
jgi:hypothetical protein